MDFEATFARHHPPLFRYLHRLTGDVDVAADIAQETFVRLLDHRVPEDGVRSWLFTVATNLVRDGARTRARRRRLLDGASDHQEPQRPDEDLDRMRRIRSVRRALGDLSARDREMLLLREEGFRYAEIATLVGVAPASVGKLLARALERFDSAYRALEIGPTDPSDEGSS